MAKKKIKKTKTTVKATQGTEKTGGNAKDTDSVDSVIAKPARKDHDSGEQSDAGGETSEEKTATTEERKEKETQKKTKGREEEGADWYVVHTYSGHENKVAATLRQKIEASHLEDKIFDVMVPTQEKIEIREGKKQTLRERIFPGYVLVKMKLDNQSWYAVRSTAGVTGFVGVGNKPTPLEAKEVETIQSFSKLEAPTYKAAFSVGEAVKIIDGPFSDFIGTVDEINEEKGRLKVLVSIFGRETPVELDFLQASKL